MVSGSSIRLDIRAVVLGLLTKAEIMLSNGFATRPCTPLIAHAVRVARFRLCEYLVVPRYVDEASLHVSVRFTACTVQVLCRSLPKVTSFSPREQFLPSASLGARTPFTAG